MTLKLKESKINVGDVVMIKENDKKQGTCEMRIKSGKCIEEKIKWCEQWESRHQKDTWNSQ